MTAANFKEVPSLLSRLTREARGLLSTELAIAKREVARNLTAAGAGLIFVGVALLFALVAIHALAVAAVLGLTDLGVPMGWGALIVFAIFAGLATLFGVMAKHRLSVKALAPNRTFENLKSDLQALEGKTNDDRQHDAA